MAASYQIGSRRVVIADPRMIRAYERLHTLAPSGVSVLLRGETGTGKEIAALALHDWSGRSGPFREINCAAIPPQLVESMLFGHARGSFTGATHPREGLFESASGGTVFLDELAELAPDIQPKLLRLLETRQVTRVGENEPREIDVRIVCATNSCIESDVAGGRFRQDLYYRLCGATLILPALRERAIEIPLLADEMLRALCERTGRERMSVAPEAMQRLLAYPWPGNIRELHNVIELAVASTCGSTIELADLPGDVLGADPPDRNLTIDSAPTPAPRFRPLADEISELERRRISEALAAAGGVKTRAAQLISMPMRTFTVKCKQYGL
jgi:two-component system, NtrC family, response regulator AtoC